MEPGEVARLRCCTAQKPPSKYLYFPNQGTSKQAPKMFSSMAAWKRCFCDAGYDEQTCVTGAPSGPGWLLVPIAGRLEVVANSWPRSAAGPSLSTSKLPVHLSHWLKQRIRQWRAGAVLNSSSQIQGKARCGIWSTSEVSNRTVRIT